MIAKIIGITLRVLGALPLSLNQLVGRSLGRLAWMTNSSARRITEFNLQHCFPDMDQKERQSLAFNSLMHIGQQFTESGWIWHRPLAQSRPLIKEVIGEQFLNDAIASKRGVIICTPHIGNWELSPLYMSDFGSLSYFYKSPRMSELGPLLLKWRSHIGGKPIPLDTGGIREALKVLKRGDILGILPDQEPDQDNGVYAPFFKQPALTMTLLSRLAGRSKAHVLYLVLERLPKSQGWRMHFLPSDPGIYDNDPQTSAAAINQGVERCIAIAPEQYVWSYKRFSTKSDGSRRRYPRK